LQCGVFNFMFIFRFITLILTSHLGSISVGEHLGNVKHGLHTDGRPRG
jgi:hypothetical protein